MTSHVSETEKEMQSLRQIAETIEGLEIPSYLTEALPEETFLSSFPKIGNPPDDQETDEQLKIFDIRRSVLWKRINVSSPTGFCSETVDKMLCERFGINVDAWCPMQYREYTGIGRNLPIDWQKLDYMKIFNIKFEAKNPSAQDKIDARKINEHFYTECGIEYLDCSQEEHYRRTDDYNKRLLRALKTRFLCQSMIISETLLGHVKNPFDEPLNSSLEKFWSNLWIVEKGRILKNDREWLEKADKWLNSITDLGDWAKSTLLEVNQDLTKTMKWMKESIHNFWLENKLSNESYWMSERNEPSIYIEKLKTYSQLLHISNEMHSKILSEVMYHHEAAVGDLGYLFQLILERLVFNF